MNPNQDVEIVWTDVRAGAIRRARRLPCNRQSQRSTQRQHNTQHKEKLFIIFRQPTTRLQGSRFPLAADTRTETPAKLQRHRCSDPNMQLSCRQCASLQQRHEAGCRGEGVGHDLMISKLSAAASPTPAACGLCGPPRHPTYTKKASMGLAGPLSSYTGSTESMQQHSCPHRNATRHTAPPSPHLCRFRNTQDHNSSSCCAQPRSRHMDQTHARQG